MGSQIIGLRESLSSINHSVLPARALPSSPVSKLSLFLYLPVNRQESQLIGGGGWGGGANSHDRSSINIQYSLTLAKGHALVRETGEVIQY
jgi:hypothetical protein